MIVYSFIRKKINILYLVRVKTLYNILKNLFMINYQQERYKNTNMYSYLDYGLL